MINRVVLVGRLTKDPMLRKTQTGTSVTSFTVACGRRVGAGQEPQTDFINCVAFGRAAEFAEKYFRQGIRIVISGRIQTGSYTNRDGVKVYTTDVIVDEQEFAESKASSDQSAAAFGGRPSMAAPSAPIGDGFMNIPDGLDEELPFS